MFCLLRNTWIINSRLKKVLHDCIRKGLISMLFIELFFAIDVFNILRNWEFNFYISIDNWHWSLYCCWTYFSWVPSLPSFSDVLSPSMADIARWRSWNCESGGKKSYLQKNFQLVLTWVQELPYYFLSSLESLN